ncbi:MAG: PQ-loop domain-containing transporter [Arenimonas sp.]
MSDVYYMLVVAGTLQSAVPVISLIAYLPQWKKLIDTKSSRDLSLRSWSIWIVSSSISLFYAVALYRYTGKGLPLVFASAAGLLFDWLAAVDNDNVRSRNEPPSI